MLPLTANFYLMNQVTTQTITYGLECFISQRRSDVLKAALRTFLIIGSYAAFFASAPLLPLVALRVIDALNYFTLSYALFRSIDVIADRYIMPHIGV